MITITVNGRTITAPDNMTILDVCKQNSIKIPTLCYMEGVSDIGMCRLCVVEVEGYKNYLPACRTKALDGMVMTTESDTLTAYRKEMLDLILANHHLDCMSCAANGTCELQDLCNRYGVKHASYEGSRREIEKKMPILDESPFITYDPGKCIHCQRCINVCHNIACNGTLKGGRSGTFHMVDAPFGKGYKVSGCESCGNCASVCPTGALTLKKEESYRNWEVKKVLTTCPHCATGCQFYLVVKDDTIVNVEPANGPSNHHRLCVKGRSGSFDFVNSPDRLKTPLIKDRATGEFREASWEEAISYTAKRLMEIKEKYGPDSLAGFACSRSANEDIYMVQKMVRTCFGTNNTDNCARVCHSATVAGLAKTLGSGAMTNP
ncbi:MAG: (2Fe-2S)-binding protein, partial [Oscillospiraceae bacterium]|nr:(2Fe-2S)-binding protein [Oscillospiraceae bacterium]